MVDDVRVAKLKQEHQSLEQAIEQEMCRPFPDTTHVGDLKRQKLRIKDEIFRISETTLPAALEANAG